MAMGNALVGEWPEPFAGLHLWRIRWQKDQVESFRNDQVRSAMPSCLIKYQDHLFARTDTHRTGKMGESNTHDRDLDRWEQHPFGLACLRVDKAVDVHPPITRLDSHPRTAVLAHPNPPEQGLETNTMFVKGPQFNLCVRVGKLSLDYLFRKGFFSPRMANSA